jgi:splicing factor 3B subunit 1
MQKVRTITALTVSALAEAAYPFGIESFDSIIRPLWTGALEQHEKSLSAFLKAIGYVIPLMDESYASHYTRLVMPILLREFNSPDEEMKKIVLQVVQQCVATAGVEPDYIRTEILPEFFRNFWIRRIALDRHKYQQVVETTICRGFACNQACVQQVEGRDEAHWPNVRGNRSVAILFPKRICRRWLPPRWRSTWSNSKRPSQMMTLLSSLILWLTPLWVVATA